jgi:hypothetical protein
LNNETGSSTTSTTNPFWSSYPVTTMDPVDKDFDVENNFFTISSATLPSAMSLDQLYNLEDKVFHALDDADLGLVTWVPANLYVTTNTLGIQRGVDAVGASGWTINVNDGTYNELVTIDKPLSLLGPNAAISAVTGTRVAEARLLERININGTTTQDVTISGFEFFEVPAPSTWTIYIQGNSDNFSIENNRFIDCEKDAIRSGISSNTANVTVTGNLIQE